MSNQDSEIPEKFWRPSTGCYACPIKTPDPEPIRNINALPGFSDLAGAYYSVPLSTWYMPVPAVEVGLNFWVAKIGKARLAQFNNMCAHEFAHNAIDGMLDKYLLRYAAGLAYDALHRLMMIGEKDSRNPSQFWRAAMHVFRELLYWNNYIEKMTSATYLVEEVLATSCGLELMEAWQKEEKNLKFYSPMHAASMTMMDQELVDASEKQLGERFREIYEKVEEIRARAGTTPLLLLARYLRGRWLLNAHKDDNALRLASRELEAAFGQDLDMLLGTLKKISHSTEELRRWPDELWKGVLALTFPDFMSWIVEERQFIAPMEDSLDGRVGSWLTRDFNPLKGSRLAEQRMKLADVMVNTLYAKEKTIREFASNPKLSDPISKALLRLLIEADLSGQHLIVIQPPFPNADVSDEAGRFGFALNKSVNPSAQFIYLTNRSPYEGGTESWASDYWHVSALIFYEGVRCQVAAGQGLSCPLAQVNPKRTGCCGFRKYLAHLWEAGNYAQEVFGMRFQQWQAPKCPFPEEPDQG